MESRRRVRPQPEKEVRVSSPVLANEGSLVTAPPFHLGARLRGTVGTGPGQSRAGALDGPRAGSLTRDVMVKPMTSR